MSAKPPEADCPTIPKAVFDNHGPGSQNAHTGHGPQNNNNANGTQYIIDKYISCKETTR